MGSDGFELEPEDERPLPEPAAPAPSSKPPGHDTSLEGADPEDANRTVKERRGEAVPIYQGAVPVPPRWPAEIVSFPLRPSGPSLIAGLGTAFVALDLLFVFGPSLAFVAFLALSFPLVFALRVQQAIVGQVAAGKDAPAGFDAALELDHAAVWGVTRFGALLGLLFLAPLLLSGWWPAAKWIAVLASPYLSVAMLGWALGDPTLARPWNALAWLARRPVCFAVGALGWWALAGGWAVMFALARSNPVGAAVASLIVRPAAVYLILLSARAIGVAGRSWTPDGYRVCEQTEA